VPAVNISPFFTNFDLMLEQLGAALQKLAGNLRSYNRAK